jgi:hypothetical protein
MDDVKQHLHTQLDGAIMAAQNNDTFGVLMGLGQITEGLAAINYLKKVPCPIMTQRLITHLRQAQPAQIREEQ